MVEEEETPAPPSRASFAPYLMDAPIEGAPASVALVRQLRGRGTEQVAGPVVWSVPFDTVEDARARYAWMLTRPERWQVWGRMASILNSETLAEFVADEAARDAASLAKEIERQREDERRRDTISLWPAEVDGRPTLMMQRGDETVPFLVLRLDQKAERDRVFDWARWQGLSYHGWRAHWEAHGSIALERLILEGMLRDERRIKAAGLGAGGRRPLRFWRGATNGES